MRVVPMLQVADVAGSSAWYQSTLGFVSGHGGDEFEMLFAGDPSTGTQVLQLHRWDAAEHGFLGTPGAAVGNGSSLWFEVDDRASFDRLWERVRERAADRVLAAPAWNPLAHHHEFALRDLDGYVLAVHTPFAMNAEG
jgi:catechol 2,3-dioxygenase-like lactoylglutathione lyase family enzyme